MEEQIGQVCSRCGEVIPTHAEGGIGYAIDEEGNLVCFACCAVQDHEYMIKHGVIDLFLTKQTEGWVIQNWPGTLVIPALRVNEGRHNWAGVQRHVWFRYEGEDWHGFQVGNSSEICLCKRVVGSVV